MTLVLCSNYYYTVENVLATMDEMGSRKVIPFREGSSEGESNSQAIA